MKKIIALAVAAVVAAPAMADLTIGAAARYQIDNGANTAADETDAYTNRVQVSFAGSSTAESGLFVSAGATLELNDTSATGLARDGDNAITIGNPMANVVLGHYETAGVYAKGADAFRVAPSVGSVQERVIGRDNGNVALNITAVENLTAQISGNLTEDVYRVVVGYDFGAFNLAAGVDQSDTGAVGVDAYQLKAGATLGGVAFTASYANQDSAVAGNPDSEFVNIGASYMGFSVNYETADVNNVDVDGVYGAYAVANAAGLEGLTVTVGAGGTDNLDTKYGVRLDYAF